MELLYKGKTKDVYLLEDGNCELQFKDDVTGADGVFDPGANTVGLTMEGAGRAGLRLTKYFFEKCKEHNIPTHYIHADIDKGTMKVKRAKAFGNGIEVICRYKAVGSFTRRYGMYATEGQDLDGFVEITLKDDDRNDPPICEDALVMLGILTREEYALLIDLTKKISGLVKNELSAKGLELFDIKFEYGKVDQEEDIVLIDEISGGNMRVYKKGEKVDPLDIDKILVG